MVEMLGVLAIIGVLSVGGIAGYSKAMEKYRLNKHAESFNMLLNASLQYSAQLKGSGYKNTENTTEYYAETLKHLNAIPDGIKYVSRDTLKDIYDNAIVVFSNNSGDFGMALLFGDNKGNEQVCANYIKTAKENHSELKRVYMQQFSGGTHTSGIGIMYGDKYCDKNKSCLRNLTLENISTLCNSCIDDCTLYIVW